MTPSEAMLEAQLKYLKDIRDLLIQIRDDARKIK